MCSSQNSSWNLGWGSPWLPMQLQNCNSIRCSTYKYVIISVEIFYIVSFTKTFAFFNGSKFPSFISLIFHLPYFPIHHTLFITPIPPHIVRWHVRNVRFCNHEGTIPFSPVVAKHNKWYSSPGLAPAVETPRGGAAGSSRSWIVPPAILVHVRSSVKLLFWPFQFSHSAVPQWNFCIFSVMFHSYSSFQLFIMTQTRNSKNLQLFDWKGSLFLFKTVNLTVI